MKNIEIRKDAIYPIKVSYHGTSTILIDSRGYWASQQIPRDQAEAICAKLNKEHS